MEDYTYYNSKLEVPFTIKTDKVVQYFSNTEKVNNPPHYNKHPSGTECIQVTRHMNFNLGNAVKYIWRADLKNNALEDLKKAAWYIQDEIQRRENQVK